MNGLQQPSMIDPVVVVDEHPDLFFEVAGELGEGLFCSSGVVQSESRFLFIGVVGHGHDTLFLVPLQVGVGLLGVGNVMVGHQVV